MSAKITRKISSDFSLGETEFVKKPKTKTTPIHTDPDMINAGVYLLTPILLGLAIGYYADKHFRTEPLFILIFLLCGTISTFYYLYRLTKIR